MRAEIIGLVLAGGPCMGLVQWMAQSKGWQRGVTVVRRLARGPVLLVGLVLLVS